jgi:hypothetical protein
MSTCAWREPSIREDADPDRDVEDSLGEVDIGGDCRPRRARRPIARAAVPVAAGARGEAGIIGGDA